MAASNEQEANDATQDILHAIELEEHDYHEMAKLGKRLKEVRQQRRAAKDIQEQARLVCEWADSNRQILKSLEQLLGSVRKAEKNVEGRIYTPRTKVVQEARKR